MDHKTINSLLDKYKDKTISPQERHVLEKAALDDPFLFDALQGYYNQENFEKLENGSKFSIRKFIPYFAAASLLIGFLITWHYMNEPKEEELISMNQKEIHDAAETAAQGELGNPTIENNSPIENDIVIEKKSSNEKTKTPEQKPLPPKPTAEPMPANSSELATDSDDIGEAPSNNDEIVSAPATPLISNEFPQTKPLEKVNPAAKSKTNKAEESSEQLKDKYVYSQSVLDETAVYPLMGKDNLNNFIKKNKVIPSYAFTYNFKGSVSVKFTVNKDGTLSEFINDNEECPDCGEEVIRLLKKSGKWATIPKGIKKETSITVKF